jgi:hypothetical protein
VKQQEATRTETRLKSIASFRHANLKEAMPVVFEGGKVGEPTGNLLPVRIHAAQNHPVGAFMTRTSSFRIRNAPKIRKSL